MLVGDILVKLPDKRLRGIKMKVINFFGGPGCGKSTTAAGLFYTMKKQNYRVEMVTEYAKELVWENSREVLADQLYLLANQNRRLERLRGKVDFVIADSPLLIAAHYGRLYGNHPEIIVPLCFDIFHTYDNINIVLGRNKPYVKLGRLGDEEAARKADKDIFDLLIEEEIHQVRDDENVLTNVMKIVEVQNV